jgi:signal transduction histidine kinase
MVPVPCAAGAYLMWKRPENSIGELLTLSSICTYPIPTMLEFVTVGAFERTGAQDWMWAPIWLAQTLTAVGVAFAVALLVVIPDGRVRYARERRLSAWSWVVVVFPLLSLLSNEQVVVDTLSFAGVEDVPSPIAIERLAPLGPALSTINAIGFLLILGAIGLLFMRYRRASQRERKQIRWVLYGGAVAILITGAPFALSEVGFIPPLQHGLLALVSSLPLIFFYVSLVIAVMEPPWVDVDIVIRKSLVYGALSFLILLVYVGVAAAFGMAAGARLDIQMAVILTVVVAVLFQPARRRLQIVADRWVFGARPTRFEAVAEFGETIDHSADPSELLPRLVETIGKTIRVQWVSATLDDGSRAVVGSVSGEPTLSVAIGAGDEEIGKIDCGPKISGAIDDDERHLVQTLAAQVALAVANARLAGRIVNTAEAERRRIERNIHDGAQQELVALVARLGMARARAARGDLTPADLEELQREAGHILADLRELAQGIHPTVLGDGGILEAVEDRCARLPIEVTLRAPDSLRTMRFDDEVEGAAYFFVSEALANVLKHSGATRAEVSLSTEQGTICLDVADNGQGFDPDRVRRNGLVGLSDRLRALGGTMTVSSRVGGGTTVRAELPAVVR